MSRYELPLAALWYHIHNCPFKFTTWLSPSDSYGQWLDRVVAEKGEECKKLGIYDKILLSKKELLPNFGLLYVFLGFYSTSANALCLPFNMIGLTLHDVAAITGLPVDGDEVLFLHDVLGTGMGFHVNKKNNAYSIYINTFKRGSGPVGDIEHRAFLLFWICYFFVCTSSMAILAEFTPYVSAILRRSYLNINALFLSLLYKGIFTLLHWMKKEESVKIIFGPFWFL